MTLAAGIRLGPYEILSPLGAGGMGEVYRARDTRLGRDVAVKVLSGLGSPSLEARQRFEREAKVISQLSHPNICALYDVGREGETEYLVMELLEGETLSRRLAAGPLPLEQALRIAVQIAEALGFAHRHGVVHRDLKPDNVMLTKTGLKLLDFGLAKPALLGSASDLTSSPTVAAVSGNVTREGTILGTLSYMAPEQLEGREADARTDIFAFGAVLYEMVTGQRAFSGVSQASVISAIMMRDPAPVSTTQPMAPAALDRLTRTCLAKDPEERWQDARDLANELRWIAEGGSQAGITLAVAAKGRRSVRIGWVLALIAGAIAGALAVKILSPRTAPAAVVATSILPPEKSSFSFWEGSWMALSPDATRMAFRAPSEDRNSTLLWMRPLNSPTSRPLPGTEDGAYPVWSPDGGSIAFMAGGKLKKVEVSNGAVQTLCEFSRPAKSGEDLIPKGADWSREGGIIFAPSARDGLYRAPASGGVAEKLTELDTARGEYSHRCPVFLPDGRRFLYIAVAKSEAEPFAIYAGSLDSKERKLLRKVDAWGRLAFSPAAGGYLTFAASKSLMAQPFNPKDLTFSGEATRLTGEQSFPPVYSISGSTLAFDEVGPQTSQLLWLDRASGRLIPIGVKPMSFYGGRLSHDGTRLATPVFDRATGDSSIWIVDLAREALTRLPFAAGTSSGFPVWSADDRRIAYSTTHGPRTDIRVRDASGTGEEEILFSEGTLYINPADWSLDGHFIALGEPGSNSKIRILDVAKRTATVLPGLTAEEYPGSFSPDGRFLAYMSDETGQNEMYVQLVGSRSGKWQISKSGGTLPAYWSRDGREILFASGDGKKILSVGVRTDPTFEATPPREIADATNIDSLLDVSPDGKRLLVATASGSKTPGTITLIQNWASALKK